MLVSVVAVLSLAVVVLVFVIWSIRRHRDPKLEIDCDAPIAEQLPSLSGLTHSAVYIGNTIELFENGSFFDVLFEEIKAAKRSVHFETFLWKEGVLGRRLVDALIERSRAGVKVRVLVDGDGGKKMGRDVASLKPEGSPPAVKVLHHAAICMARQTIRIQNPYFLPDDEAIEALGQAVERGVDVRVMVPSADASDMPIVQHAAHRNFHKMLERGVRIFEYGKCLLHQKVMTVDGEWCAIGSSNFDDRSFETNDEITLSIRDSKLALQLEDVFSRDCRECTELQLETWQARGVWHRFQDNVLHVFNELL